MYIISSEWLFKWKCFVQNKISRNADKKLAAEVRKSENAAIGILPPGPITNRNLFREKETGEEHLIKEGLQMDKDYKSVCKEVWDKFNNIYGGGPVIIRKTSDIYSEPILIPKILLKQQESLRSKSNLRKRTQQLDQADATVGKS